MTAITSFPASHLPFQTLNLPFPSQPFWLQGEGYTALPPPRMFSPYRCPLAPSLPVPSSPTLTLQQPTQCTRPVDGLRPRQKAMSSLKATLCLGATSATPIFPENVINLFSYSLSSDELELLSLGLSFVPSPHSGRFSTDELRTNFTTLQDTHMARYSCSLPISSKRILDSICSQIEEDLGHVPPRCVDPNLPLRLRKALKILKYNT